MAAKEANFLSMKYVDVGTARLCAIPSNISCCSVGASAPEHVDCSE